MALRPATVARWVQDRSSSLLAPRSSLLAISLLSVAWASCSAEDGQEPSLRGVEELATTGYAVSSLKSPCLIARESLQDYAKRCEDAIGVKMPGFECEDGAALPNQGGSLFDPSASCDAPNVLNHECDPGSKFQVLRRAVVDPMTGVDDGIYIVAHCRKRGQAAGNNKFEDVAMIAHNKKTGATCFFQTPQTEVSGSVVAPWDSQQTNPSGAKYYNWQDPATTAGQRCIGCHDNGPFLRSPYLGQLGSKDPAIGVWIGGPQTPLVPDARYLPGTKQSEQHSWNHTSHPYKFVGTDFQSWKTYRVDVGSNVCTSCHRLAISTNNGLFRDIPIGTARDYGLQSTAASQLHKNTHGPDSPIWMQPGQTFYQAAAAGSPDAPLDPDDAAARRVATCAEWIVDGKPSASTPPGICRDILFGQGNTCNYSSPQVFGGGATQSTETSKKKKSSVVLSTCVAGQDCETGFPYFTSLHGPFFQRSAANIPIGSLDFRGGYVRTFVNTSSQWEIEAGFDATDLPVGTPSPGWPGGTVESINYSRVASIFTSKKCTQNGLSLTVTGSTPLSSSTLLGNRETLAILGTLIGNVSPNTAVGASRLFVSQVGSDNLLQQYHAAQPTVGRGVPSWFSADAFVHSCPDWNASQYLVVQDASTSDDRQLVDSTLASKVICYLTGVGGNWGHTVPDPSNPQGSIQSYAQIYVGPSNDIRLKVGAADRVNVPVTASASCLRVEP